MRVTSELFVAALSRRVFGAGGYAAVLKRGAAEAGAIFIIARSRAGEFVLYGPAAQTDYDERKPVERLFSVVVCDRDETTLHERLAREERFDPDLWIVEIEPSGPVAELITITSA